MARLINALFIANRNKDITLALKDPEYRQKLYREFQIA